jgi:hypothetical protein
MGFHDGQYGCFPPTNTQLQNLQTSKICLYTILAMLQSGYPLTWPRAQQHKGCHWAQWSLGSFSHGSNWPNLSQNHLASVIRFPADTRIAETLFYKVLVQGLPILALLVGEIPHCSLLWSDDFYIPSPPRQQRLSYSMILQCPVVLSGSTIMEKSYCFWE